MGGETPVNNKRLHRQIGLFAGLFSSADGSWIPMEQLRRMSATGAWMLFFGFVAYRVINCGLAGQLSTPRFLLGALIFGAGSYWVFIY